MCYHVKYYICTFIIFWLKWMVFNAGRSIPVVRMIRVHVDRVRFSAPRQLLNDQKGNRLFGVSYSGSTQAWGACSRGSIPRTPTNKDLF